MDFSAGNKELWHSVIQFGIIAAGILFANILRRKVPFIRNGLVPTAVITGFGFLILKSTGVFPLDSAMLEKITYHGIAIGFIALSLRIPKQIERNEKMTASKSGALIVSTYLFQAIIGFVTVLLLAYTFMPNLFKASGILLPMGFGQGPGQANNVGSTYELLGFVGGKSFGLSLAAAGYICACVIGVVYLNIIAKKGKIRRKKHDDISGSVSIDIFQDKDEIPVAESIDKFSIQVALVVMVYSLTYLITLGITSLLQKLSPGVSADISPLLWGFNFITGSMLALLLRAVFKSFGRARLMTRQYQNNYLLSRISGFAFDLMIIAGIASINISELSGLWVPFILLSVLGGFLTLFYLKILCKKLCPNYYYEGLLSMYGMLTGTISSGVLLLREIDPSLDKPAANNMVTGSSYGIIMGAPLLIIISMAPKSDLHAFISLGIIVVYWALLISFIYFAKNKRKN
ncbi:MAG: sodium:glutamate symporter [Firmicutes bacterium HGW-Firmicutes-21]|nr:MAG: sodium:glutamate symporter [Firmicutes bacterium HGW-Firmicutes-21]